LIAILAIQTITAEEYTPLTRDEAAAYIDKCQETEAGREQLINDIIQLDYMEHTTPPIPDPAYTAMLHDNGDLIIFPLLKISYIQWGKFSYSLTYPQYILKDFYKPQRTQSIIISAAYFAGGVFFGFILGTIVD